jgi:hypothetical protein
MFLTSLNPDCSSQGTIIVKLTGKPKSGTVILEEIEHFPDNSQDYKKCIDKVRGTAVSYDPDPDFTGTDTFSGTVLYPSGRARKFETKVTVE